VATAEAGILTFLLNAAWQVPALAAAAWIGARLVGRGPAAHRHLLWVAALALATLLPFRATVWPERASLVIPLAPAEAARAASRSPADRLAGGLGGADAAEEVDGPGTPIGRLAVWAYILFTSACAIRLLHGVVQTRRIGRGARELRAARFAARVADWSRALGISSVEIAESAEVRGPATLGLLRPIIALPPRFLEEFEDELAASTLAHELAHVARRDYTANLLCELLFVPIAFHPIAWCLRRRVAESREAACDAAAAALVGRDLYAEALVGVAARLTGLERPAFGLGVLDAGILEERMNELLNAGPRLGLRTARLLGVTAGAFLLLASMAATSLAVSVAPAFAADSPASLAGVWKGMIPKMDGDGELPGADLHIRVADGRPVVAMTMYRHLRKDDGGVETTPYQPRVISQGFDGKRLTFRTRDELAFRPGAPKETVEADWEFVLKGADAAELQPTRNSHFEAAKARGEDVPPPPPPLRMKREK
jgi:beta-lactamase regulating signal transducer with metallopeptidase domain